MSSAQVQQAMNPGGPGPPPALRPAPTPAAPAAIPEADSVSVSSGEEGATPLMYACQQGREQDVRAMLKARPSLALERDRTGKTALHYCAEQAGPAAAAPLLQLAPQLLDAKDQDGYCALTLAVIAGNRSLVRYLLARGADVDALDNEKHSVVHWATVCGEAASLELVLGAGARASTPDLHGGYPLHYAAQLCGPLGPALGPAESAAVGALLERGAGLAVLRALLAAGAPVGVHDQDGRQPILWAASAGSADAILALVNAAASVEADDKDGLTALHCAASRGHTDCVETLVGLCGADVDVIDSNGCTALFYAVTLGHADCTRVLLAHGAEPNRQDRKGRTAAHCGAAKGQLETLRILAAHGANLWLRNVRGDFPLHDAVQSGRKDLVLWLLQQRPDAVNTPNNDGRCPLHIAALHNNVEMCKVLLDNRALLNPVMRSSRQQLLTPLDAALHRGNRGCAKYLQLHGGVPASRLTERSAQTRGGGHRSTVSEPAPERISPEVPVHANRTRSVGNSPASFLPPAHGAIERTTFQVHVDDDDVAIRHVEHIDTGLLLCRHVHESSEEQDDRPAGTRKRRGRRPERGSSDIMRWRERERQDRLRSCSAGRRDDSDTGESDEESRRAGRDKRRRRFVDVDNDERVVQAEEGRESGRTSRRRSRRSRAHKEKEEKRDPEDKSGPAGSATKKHVTYQVITRTSTSELEVSDHDSEEGDRGRRKSSKGRSPEWNSGLQQSGSRSQGRSSSKGSRHEEAAMEISSTASSNTTEDSPGRGEAASTVISSKTDPGRSTVKSKGKKREVIKDGSEKESGKRKEDARKGTSKRDGTAKEGNIQKEGAVGDVKENVDKSYSDKAEENVKQKEEERGKSIVWEGKDGERAEEKRESSNELGSESSHKEDTTNDSDKKEDTTRDSERRLAGTEVGKHKEDVQSEGRKRDDSSKESSKKDDARKEPVVKCSSATVTTTTTTTTVTVHTQETESQDEDGGEPTTTVVTAMVHQEEDRADQQQSGAAEQEVIVDQAVNQEAVPIPPREEGTAPEDTNASDSGKASSEDKSNKTDGEDGSTDVSPMGSPRDDQAVREGEVPEIDRSEDIGPDTPSDNAPAPVSGEKAPAPASAPSAPAPTPAPAPEKLQREGKGKGRRVQEASLESRDSSKTGRGRRKVAPAATKGQRRDSKLGRTSQDHDVDDGTTDATGVVNGDVETVIGSEDALGLHSPVRDEDGEDEGAVSEPSTGRSHNEPDSQLVDSGLEPSPRREKPSDKDAASADSSPTRGDGRVPRICRRKKDRPGSAGDTEDGTVSVTRAVQLSMRKYHLERRIFHELLELKRLQIRAGRANEQVLVKRLVDDYRRAGLCVGLQGFTGTYTFRSFEKYLYDQLRALQSSNRRIIPRLQSTDDLEKLTAALRRTRQRDQLNEAPDNPLHCTASTHRCHHAVHAYSGVPCAAYIPRLNHHNMPKDGLYSGFLPHIEGATGSGSGSGRGLRSGHGALRFVDPSRPVTLELSHGQDKQVISLPTERLDKNKRYYVTFTIKGTPDSAKLAQPPATAHPEDTPTATAGEQVADEGRVKPQPQRHAKSF